MGALSMTRAIGDHFLRRHGVIAEPEISGVRRGPQDELLLIATDGLWNFVSCEEAAAVARRALQRADAAAAVPRALTKLALSRGGTDNISVMVVDLRPDPAAAAAAPAPAPAAAAPLAAALRVAQPQAAGAPSSSPFLSASMQLPQLNLAPIRTRQAHPPADGSMGRSHSEQLAAWLHGLPAVAVVAPMDDAHVPFMLRAKSAPVRMHHHIVTTGGPRVPPPAVASTGALPPAAAARACSLPLMHGSHAAGIAGGAGAAAMRMPTSCGAEHYAALGGACVAQTAHHAQVAGAAAGPAPIAAGGGLHRVSAAMDFDN